MLDYRLIAGCGLAAAAAFLARSEYERKALSLEEVSVETDKITRDWTFVFLSDLHENTFGRDNERLLAAIDAVKPDAVLSGGDLIVTKKGRAKTAVSEALLARLAARYPVYCGNGNHENRMVWTRKEYGGNYERYIGRLKEMGIICLSDQSAVLKKEVRISAVNLDPCFYKKANSGKLSSMEPEYVEKKLGPAAGKDCFQILLAHSPLFFDAYRKWGADLTLSGHFHGGTIRIPGLGGVMTPQYQFFLPVCAGTHEREGRYMAVSRGLGTHSINIRLNNRPQLLAIRLKRKIM